MSSSAAKIGATIANPIGAITGSILNRTGATQRVGSALGISDPSTAGLLSGAITGSLPGAILGQEQGQQIENQRDQAEADESNRRQFNDDIFRLAESLQGRLAGSETSDFDFDSLSFAGADPRTDRLRRLVQAFSVRRGEIQQQTFEPGSSQTRLSLAE